MTRYCDLELRSWAGGSSKVKASPACHCEVMVDFIGNGLEESFDGWVHAAGSRELAVVCIREAHGVVCTGLILGNSKDFP